MSVSDNIVIKKSIISKNDISKWNEILKIMKYKKQNEKKKGMKIKNFQNSKISELNQFRC